MYQCIGCGKGIGWFLAQGASPPWPCRCLHCGLEQHRADSWVPFAACLGALPVLVMVEVVPEESNALAWRSLAWTLFLGGYLAWEHRAWRQGRLVATSRRTRWLSRLFLLGPALAVLGLVWLAR
jgi:hypothetical protein